MQKPPLPNLPAQLMLAMGTWLTSPFALQCANAAWGNWKNNANPSELQKAVSAEAQNRASKFLSGILRYVETPYRRSADEKPAIWYMGNARLLDYGQAGGTPLLVIPSLINKYYILDLEEERSFLRFLATQGIHPLVLDWGTPGEFEKDFNCADYITEILLPALEFIHQTTGKKVALAGYCMGGIFALALSQLARKHVSTLTLLATPWNFHCNAFLPFVVGKPWQDMIASLLKSQESIPADTIQSLFYMTDPWVFEQKFRRFAGMSDNAAGDFIALEHWVNDGVPMTAGVAKDCLIDWAQKNQLVEGKWKVDGKKITPEALKIPAFIAIPKNDHVVPQDCAVPLAKSIKGAHIVSPDAGHVGMIVGKHAKNELWQPLSAWLSKH
jgi:polyhydroxyalkanoate synthase